MKKYLFVFVWLITGIASAVIYSCTKTEDVAQENLNHNYFPLNPGSERIYIVDTVKYDYSSINKKFDTIRYEMREVIDSPFRESNGDLAYKVLRYHRKKDTEPWEYYKTFTAKITKYDAERMEENTRFIRMVFPIKKNKSWNGNRYNNLDSIYGIYNYFYDETGVPYTINQKKYDSTCLVHICNYADGTTRHVEEERYAAGVGLIYKYHLDTTHSDSSKPYPDEKNYTNYKMYLKSYK